VKTPSSSGNLYFATGQNDRILVPYIKRKRERKIEKEERKKERERERDPSS
jgi:hypothetical protein